MVVSSGFVVFFVAVGCDGGAVVVVAAVALELVVWVWRQMVMENPALGAVVVALGVEAWHVLPPRYRFHALHHAVSSS